MRTDKHSLFFALILVLVGLNWGYPTRKVYAQEAKQEDVNSLVQKLKDKNPYVRRKAAEALGEIKDARAIEPLIAALKDENPEVREKAAEALGGIKDARAVEPLIAALKDKNPEVRQWAAEALREIKDARAVELLIATLKDKNPDVRQWAAKALGKIKDAHAVEPLIAALKDEDPDVRRETAGALGEIKDGRAVEPLIAALKDEDPGVRWWAAGALGEIKDARAVGPLIAALKDENSTLRWWAAGALGEIKDARAVEPLIAALKDQNSEVRRGAANALGWIKDARAVKPLVAALKDENPEIRQGARWALGEMGQHIITELKRYRWGQYNVVIYVEQGLQIQDRRGEVLREIRVYSSADISSISFLELTGGGTPELHVQTYSGGVNCCYADYYFTQDGGLRNLLIFIGSKTYIDDIDDVKDLNRDGRPELIAGNDILFDFGNHTVVEMVIGWDGKRYVDQTRRYPALARQEARENQTEFLESEDEESALRYYANSLVIGEGQAARAWLLKHASREIKEGLLSNEEDLLRLLTKSACKIRVSQERILYDSDYECNE